MIRIERVNLETLDDKNHQRLLPLTEPKYRPSLEGKDPYGISDTTIVAIQALEENTPIALILASVHPTLNHTMIHSFQFAWGKWNEHLASQMLQSLEKELIKEHGRIATFFYRNEDPYTPVLDAAFEKQGWAEPELVIIRYFFHALTFNPPWMKNVPKLPKEYTLFPWKQLTEKDRNSLLHKQKQGRIPSAVSPFGEDEKIIEPLNSFGIRYKDEVIGWIVTHRVAPDTIRYSSLFIFPDYQFLGYSITLLVESMERHKSSTVKWALFELRLAHVEESWIKFVNKRLAPVAYHISEVYKTWKEV